MSRLLCAQAVGKVIRLSAAVPNIYAVPPSVDPVGWKGRVLAAAIGLGCLGVLVLAASLPPSRSGMGTHRESLGLPPCNFLQRTGLPCPSCGMTTSWAWASKGHFAAAFYVQPMGAALALMAAACVWGGLYIAFTGRPAHRLLRMLPTRYTLLPLLLLAVLAWGWKILIHLNKWDGWGT